MASLSFKKFPFIFALALVCSAYLLFQFFYTYYATISVDEFWFAHWIYRYKTGLPYRDFLPYKTVLGYYLLLPIMLLSHGWLDPLLNVKNILAIVNTAVFFGCSIWLTRFFDKRAVLISVALISLAEFVLIYSTNVRIDCLAYWLCLISVLLLYEKKFVIAGAILGLGFLISQKAIWYLAASNVALTLSWLVFYRNWYECRRIIIFNCSIICIIAVYIIFWASFSSLHTVLHSIFYEAYIMYQLDWYEQARKLFWQMTLYYNPLLFLLWPVAFISLLIVPENKIDYQKRFFATVYGTCILLLLIPYKQVFPYYMMATVPAFLLLYTGFFSWIEKLCHPAKLTKILRGDRAFAGLTVIYTGLFIYIASIFKLPYAYWLILCIPLCLLAFLFYRHNTLFLKLIALTIIFVGLLYPLILIGLSLPARNGEYQKANLALARALVNEGNYLAGIELFYDKNQPIAGLRHLDGVAINYLYTPSEKLRPAMLESLYRSPQITISSTIADLEKSKVLFYVNNYRTHALPPQLITYLNLNYEHFWGSIYLYAPYIQSSTQTITIKFTGNYRVEADTFIQLNGKKMGPQRLIYLTEGNYLSSSARPYRLKWLPNQIKLQADNQNDHWEKMLG